MDGGVQKRSEAELANTPFSQSERRCNVRSVNVRGKAAVWRQGARVKMDGVVFDIVEWVFFRYNIAHG